MVAVVTPAPARVSKTPLPVGADSQVAEPSLDSGSAVVFLGRELTGDGDELHAARQRRQTAFWVDTLPCEEIGAGTVAAVGHVEQLAADRRQLLGQRPPLRLAVAGVAGRDDPSRAC
jgi:hypothetical protein